MSAFTLAKRRKKVNFSLAPSKQASTPTLNANSVAKTNVTFEPRKTPFSDDHSDEDDDSLATEKRIVRRVTSISTSDVRDNPNPSLKRENVSSSVTSSQGSRTDTFLNKVHQSQSLLNATKKSSQIGRMLEKRRGIERLMLSKASVLEQNESTDSATPAQAPQVASSSGHKRIDDDTLFHLQLEQCANDARSEMYNATPVSGFGEAMLKAMGWKGSTNDLTFSNSNSGDRETADLPKPRPDRLGLGAKLAFNAPPLPPARKRRRISIPQNPQSVTNAERDQSRGITISTDDPSSPSLLEDSSRSKVNSAADTLIVAQVNDQNPFHTKSAGNKQKSGNESTGSLPPT